MTGHLWHTLMLYYEGIWLFYTVFCDIKTKVKIMCILTVFHSIFFPYKIKETLEIIVNIKNILTNLFKKNKETPSGHQEGEINNAYYLLQSHQKKGLTAVHLQYFQSSDRWQPNHINSCLFAVFVDTALGVKCAESLEVKLHWEVYFIQVSHGTNKWIHADNSAKVHLSGFQTLKLTGNHRGPPSAAGSSWKVSLCSVW